MSLHTMAVAAFAGAAMSALAASSLRWIEQDYDFGLMQEVAGRKTGFARFVNEGPDSTWIDYVRPSCGCTDADFTKGVIAPGDTAIVSFTYNPVGRPGIFEKTVKVYVGPDKKRHVIKIRGTVLGSNETLSALYPVDCSPLRLSTRLIDLGKVNVGTGRHVFVTMVNASTDSITPAWQPQEGMSIDVTPKTLGPGDIATMGIYLNSTGAATSQVGEKTFLIPFEADSCRTEIAIRAEFINKPTE